MEDFMAINSRAISSRFINSRKTIGAIALVSTLGACSVADQAAQNSSASATTQVRLLTHDSFAMSDELAAAFTNGTDGRYEVTTVAPGDSSMVVNQLILNKEKPSVDVVYGIDSFSAQKAIDEGVIAEYTPNSEPGSEYREGNLTAIDVIDVCVNYDPAWFTAHSMTPPESFNDLARPEYAKLLVAQNPTTSATGQAFFFGAFTGTPDWKAFWQDLIDGGAKISESWSDSYYVDFSGAEGKGEYPLVVSYSSSPAETEGATAIVPGTCTRQVEYAGVVAGAENPIGAQAFIDFMLADEFQVALPEAMYVYPVADVELPETWAQYAQLVDDPILPDLAVVGAQRDALLAQWTENFAN